jgi:hypothetical protein
VDGLKSNQVKCVAGKSCGTVQSVSPDSSVFYVYLTAHCVTHM